jgi:glycogen synthase
VKVLVVSNLYPPDFIGGYELGCRQVVDALRGLGHDVRVLTSVPRGPVPAAPHIRRRLQLTIDHWDPYFRDHSAPVTSHIAEVESHQINAGNVFRLIEELEDFRPDVVYLWMLSGLGGLGLVGGLQHLRVPWVWHLMDAEPLVACRRRGAIHPVLAREYERQVRGRYLACSRRLLDEIGGSGLRLVGEVEIVPNWIVGTPAPRRTGYLESGTLRVVSAGQLSSHKGIHLIIEAAKILKDEGQDRLRIDLFGKETETTFRALAQRLGVSDRVCFRGVRPQAELLGLYEEYDVFAFPTWEREPFAFAPLEAAARGCVPVQSEVCGNSEWMVHGVHCLKAPRTSEALAAVFRKILEGRIDLAALGRRAGAVVRRDFHLDALIPRIEGALERSAREPRAAGGRPEEAYRLALLAEKLARLLVQEPFRAA